jgi:hypothetical protein
MLHHGDPTGVDPKPSVVTVGFAALGIANKHRFDQ